jgi:hypothetical protein
MALRASALSNKGALLKWIKCQCLKNEKCYWFEQSNQEGDIVMLFLNSVYGF